MDSQQQREVAAGLREGSSEAWRALYETYAQRVWRNVARLVGRDASAVADIVQETFMAAARSARGYDPGRGSLWLWLWGIALNHVRLYFRREAKHERLQAALRQLPANNGVVLHWLEGRQDAPTAALESAELSALVRAALVELPDDYATLLTAKYLDDATMQQIADDQNTTVAAVNSKLARARRAFREKFQRLSPRESDDEKSNVYGKTERRSL